MKIEIALLASLYVPVVVFCAFAIFRYAGGLFGVIYRGDFSMERHGVWVALVCMMSADLVENIYYGMARYSAEVYARLGWMSGAIIPMKLLILTGAIVACSSWCEVRYRNSVLIQAALIAAALWSSVFAFLMLRQ